MSSTAVFGTAPGVKSGAAAVRVLANAMIAVAVFLGGFVIFEPAPYELMVCGMLGIWLLFGMRIPREALPLLILFTTFNLGGLISSFMMRDWSAGFIYVAVSYFLALSSVFFAILVIEDMSRLRLIFRSYVAAATITSALGIIGYLDLVPGFEMFTRYSRAMGAFQDPNVFGPFLVPAMLYVIYGIVNRAPALLPVRMAILLILFGGILLSFSRAAWGLAALSAILFYILLVINEQKAKVRLKYIVIAVVGALALILLVAALTQVHAVSVLLEQRLKLVQDYDGGRTGRFARHLAGYLLATERPFGIGPLRFGYIFTEDTHNNFVKALMDYGWIGFLSWISIMGITLVAGFKLLFMQRPWLPYYQIAYVVFLGHQVIGNVIDTDHWRHFYLMTGLIWGCIGLERRWQRNIMAESSRQNARSRAQPRTSGRPLLARLGAT